MSCFMRGVALGVVGLVLGMPAPARAEKPDEKPKKVTIEFRRAETKPADGLVEIAVPGSKDKLYVRKTADATNEDIANAQVGVDVRGKPAIDITFTKAGAKKMAKLSEAHLGKPLVILIDGKPVSAPVIRVAFSDQAQITGEFTAEEAQRIARGLGGR